MTLLVKKTTQLTIGIKMEIYHTLGNFLFNKGFVANAQSIANAFAKFANEMH